MTQLLVSVRSVAEAEAALAGGAHLIDVKEPARGSLGRADDVTLADIISFVAGRRPVSAALGELSVSRDEATLPPDGLAFVKWGLSGYRGAEDACAIDLRRAADRLPPSRRLVAVAYADHPRARAPEPEWVADLAVQLRAGAFLLDTWRKDGTTLLDWLTPAAVGRLADRCREGGARVALAGSLGERAMETLRGVRPDWFAVRGAACRGGRRTSHVESWKVRHLAEFIMSYQPEAPAREEPVARAPSIGNRSTSAD